MNFDLGKEYTLLTKASTPEDFRLCIEHGHYDTTGDEAGVYAFVCANDGRDIHPLYASHKNYIMTGDGATYANVSLR